jgi:hypothetical protein
MQCVLLIYTNETAYSTMTAAQASEMTASYMAYAEAMSAAGVNVGGARLRPVSSATTVRTTGGKTQVLDGPYADTKEQLGGYFIIDVPDMDAALSWAQRCPGTATGVVEVRPIWPMSEY